MRDAHRTSSSRTTKTYTSTAKVQVRPINVNPQASQGAGNAGDSVATEMLVARSLPVATIAADLLTPPAPTGTREGSWR